MSHTFARYTFRLLLLAYALAGCADNTLTAPTAAESDELVTPAFNTGAVPPNYLIYFTRLTGLPRATAIASALPASRAACYSMEQRTGEWRLTLTDRQRAAFASALAAGATASVVWGTNATFHFGGFKQVTVWESMYDSNGAILLNRDADHRTSPNGENPAGGTFDTEFDLATAQTDLLLAGGSITVSIKGAAEAWVDERDCGLVVAGAMAMWRFFVEPTVHVH